MVWLDRSSHDICEQMLDRARNGGRTLADLVQHVTEDKLVRAGWKAGDGRAPPPLPHDEFARRFKEWVEKGAASPE